MIQNYEASVLDATTAGFQNARLIEILLRWRLRRKSKMGMRPLPTAIGINLSKVSQDGIWRKKEKEVMCNGHKPKRSLDND